ncbi:MAG: BamA/TamA family outer membrane protein [Kofleriaceae bacterium]
MITRWVLVAALVLASTAPVRAEDPPPPGLTTETWHHEPRLDLHWQLLTLPERAIELVFVPFGLAVAAVERHRIDRRVGRLLSFWEGRLKLSPRMKISFGDGLGVGLKLKYKQPFDTRTQASLGFVVRVNRDFLVDSELQQPIGSLDDRSLHVNAFVERDQNERFYRLGGGSSSMRRVMTNNLQVLTAGLDLQPVDWYDYSGLFEVGAVRQTLGPGLELGEIPLGEPDDSFAPPPGFGTSTVYAHANISGSYDTRDTLGRPSRGLHAELRAALYTDVAGGLAGANLRAAGAWFLPVLPEARVLVLNVGASAAVPLFGETIPLVALSQLGREHHLRGYDRARFRDRYAVWAGAEYRFPIYEYLTTGVGLDTFVFLEGASVFGATPPSRETFAYSAGGGLRIAAETKLVSQLTFGWSPEGIEIFIGSEVKL